MNFHILTIFPRIFDSYFNESIIKRAQSNNIIKIFAHDLRDWTSDKHHTVDDTPYGGGAGMVMKIEVLYRALREIESSILNLESEPTINQLQNSKFKIQNSKTILLSAKGVKWTQAKAREYAQLDSIIFICGRYEGVDERILDFIDEEISIGDYVMTGGELGTMVMIDSIARLLPGVLGNEASAISESHSDPGILEYPQYTRPEIFIDDQGNEHRVPDVLLSGNHAEIEKWRRNMMKNT